MRGKSNVINRNIIKVWGARYTLGARYLPKNTVILIHLILHSVGTSNRSILIQLHKQSKAPFPLLQLAAFNF
jgi:S-adenosylmethionine hydrolase